MYLPSISLIQHSNDFIFTDKEQLKPIIEIIHLLIESPIKTAIQENFIFLTTNQKKNSINDVDEILLLKEFLVKQKKINAIKRITFIGDKITGTAGLFMPIVGILNYVSSYLTNPIFRKIEKSSLKKIATKYPALRHLYFSESELLKDELMNMKKNQL